MVQVGLLCVQDNAKDRPSMSNVVFMLSNETVLPSPKKSSFPVRNSEPDSSTTGTKCSINDVTNTTFDGEEPRHELLLLVAEHLEEEQEAPRHQTKKFKKHWRSGPWNGRNLNGLPDIGSCKDYFSDRIDLINITFVSNDNEIYVKFSPQKVDVFSIIVMELIGLLKRLIWHESQRWVKVQVILQDMCDEYMQCGANAICNEVMFAHCACMPGFERLYPHD
ncbi:hypothetical protein Q3G72_014808 [Acer saccharum]|nr:hypothetical protein Q3G72_014808 [Acer saccharum]